MPRLRPKLDVFTSASFVLENDAAYAAAKSDSFVGGLVSELEATFASLKPALAEAARDELLASLLKARCHVGVGLPCWGRAAMLGSGCHVGVELPC